LAVVLTAINLALLLILLAHFHPAAAEGPAPVLRGRALEIVDSQGRVRAQIQVLPPSRLKDGRTYPEMALLRLIDRNGRPGVKVGTSVEGSVMSLEGDSERREWSGVQVLAGHVLADSPQSTVKLTNRSGRVRILQP
jgi:hypothetical protein